MDKEIFHFTVDGVEVEAREGQSIIAACDAAGIYIPRLDEIEPGHLVSEFDAE